jgi:hypothetical protein
MAKLTVATNAGWPVMTPLGKKESDLLGRNISSGEKVLGQVIGNFGQAVVATDHKILVLKTGMMAGQTFGGKATSFDYHMIGGIEVRTGFSQGELEIINPAMPGRQGNRNRDKAKINESPNGVVFPKVNGKFFEQFASKVRERVSMAHAPAAVAPPAQPEHSIPEQIKQLAELHTAGILTEDEFSTKKAELLARM